MHLGAGAGVKRNLVEYRESRYDSFKEGPMKRIILIDFENIQKLDFDLIDTAATEILVFVGRSQNKIPFSIVEKAQILGERIRWIKIAGDGKNNLDFHIAFELGRLAEKPGKDATLVILSKDNGYDSLIGYMKVMGLHVQRIANLAELADSTKQLPSSKFTDYIVANLTKIDPQKRPRTRSTLKKHAESLLRERASAAELDLVIEEMFVRALLTQTGNRLKYALEAQ
jgi:hypothetical protein